MCLGENVCDLVLRLIVVPLHNFLVLVESLQCSFSDSFVLLCFTELFQLAQAIAISPIERLATFAQIFNVFVEVSRL